MDIDKALKAANSRPGAAALGVVVGLALGVGVSGDDATAPAQPVADAAPRAHEASVVAPPANAGELSTLEFDQPGPDTTIALAGPDARFLEVIESGCTNARCVVRARNRSAEPRRLIIIVRWGTPP